MTTEQDRRAAAGEVLRANNIAIKPNIIAAMVVFSNQENVHRLTAQAGLVGALEAAYAVLLERDLEREGWGETPLLIQIRIALNQAKDG